MAATWRYFARRLNGDGTETYIADLDLSKPSRTRQLSGPPAFTAEVNARDDLFDENGDPLLIEWSTAIYAELDGRIRGGFILINGDFDGPTWSLDCAGFSLYPTGQPYTGAQYWVQVDPLFLQAHIWEHVQSQGGGNLGVIVDDTTSPVRIGRELEQVQFEAETSPGVHETVSFEAGPYKLNWYTNDDLGSEIDDLASDTPFDWTEEHSWGVGQQIVHLIRRGYPRLGRRRSDMRLEIDVNVSVEPKIRAEGEDYADTVIVLGAGEGSSMIRGSAHIDRGRLRRAVTVQDKQIKSISRAVERARNELALRTGAIDLDAIEVWDHTNAPLDAIELGDELLLTGRVELLDISMWVRIVSIADDPDDGDTMQLSVVRADLGN